MAVYVLLQQSGSHEPSNSQLRIDVAIQTHHAVYTAEFCVFKLIAWYPDTLH